MTFHVDCLDAYSDSPIWKQYLKEGLIHTNADGSPRPQGAWAGRTAYRVNMVAEWKKGFLQKRLNELFDTVPELKKSGVIYFDANVQFAGDPLDHTSAQDELDAYLTMCSWLKARHGIDVVGEYTYPALYGFVPVGFTRPSGFGNDPLEAVPPYLASGGRPNAGGDMMTALFGYNTQVEGSHQNSNYWKTPDRDPKVAEFYFYTLPYLYVNRLLCLGVVPNESVTFSEGVQRLYDKKTGQIMMLQQGKLMQIGNDVIPPVWRNDREVSLIRPAESRGPGRSLMRGRMSKRRTCTASWPRGRYCSRSAGNISSHAITLTLKPRRGRYDRARREPMYTPIPPIAEGEAKCLGLDTTTKGDWLGR